MFFVCTADFLGKHTSVEMIAIPDLRVYQVYCFELSILSSLTLQVTSKVKGNTGVNEEDSM